MRKFDTDVAPGKINPGSIKKILPFFSGYKKTIILAVITISFATFLGAILPLIFRELIDNAIPSRSMDAILKVGVLYFGVLFFSVGIQFVQQLIVGYMGIEIVGKVKLKLLKHMFNLSISFFDKHGTGKLISRIESDAQQLYMLFSAVGLNLVWASLNLIISLCIMTWVNYKLTLFVIVIAPIYFVISYVAFKKMRPMFRREREIYASITGFLAEHIKGISTIRSMGNIAWSKKKFDDMNEEKWKYSVKIHFFQTMIWSILLITPNMVIAVILYKSVGWIAAELITIGTVWMFIQYIMSSIHPLIIISEQVSEIQKSLGASDRIFEILETKSLVNDPKQPLILHTFQKKIEFKNVSFHYVEGEPVLDNISFEIEKGSTVAIVGPTGSGKSTIISLLCRFYDPLSGSILIDGVDIRDISRQNLRSFLGLVLQDIYLFPDNILENLRVFRKDIPTLQVEQAARHVDAWKFISRLPDGIKTSLAEEGGNFSYGERQLLSFARALTFSPEILIMDEATSSVDPQTEALIQKSLKKLTSGRTSIVVAHRLSTIVDADNILVLSDGKIVERGDHNELMSHEGIYHSYFLKQNRSNLFGGEE